MTTPDNEEDREFADPEDFVDFNDVDSATVDLGPDTYETPTTDVEGCD